MNIEEQQYLDLLKKITNEGNLKENRTGIDTKSIFGHQMRFSLQNGKFPLLTTKKLHTKSIIHELLWFISGDTNIKYLQDNGVRIWNEWVLEDGTIGKGYGYQWRKWTNMVKKGGCPGNTDWIPEYHENEPVDQLLWAQNRLRTNPDCRRIIITAWNPAELNEMALPPCHMMFQFYTHKLNLDERVKLAEERNIVVHSIEQSIEDVNEYLTEQGIPERYLSSQLYQRSADTFLGVPFNIASYALLTCMMAQSVNMLPYEFVWTGGDVHLYENHKEQVRTQVAREPLEFPTIKINPERKNITDFKFEDFEICNYQSHPSIKATVAV